MGDDLHFALKGDTYQWQNSAVIQWSKRMATGVVRLQNVVCVEISKVRSTRQMARILKVSESTLRRDFNKHEGMPFSKYQTMVRIERIQDLLGRTSLSHKEILISAGYSWVETGARAFKRIVGMTMGQFKEAQVNQKRVLGA